MPLWEWLVLRHVYVPLIRVLKNADPNIISLGSLALALMAVWAFGSGIWWLGGLLFEASFVLDCVDGPVARLSGKTSRLGILLETVGDSIRLVGSAVAMAYSLTHPHMPQPRLLFVLLGAYLTSLTAGIWLYPKSVETQLKGGETLKFHSSGEVWLVPTWVDLEAVAFFLLPLIGKPWWSMWLLGTIHPLMTLAMGIHQVVESED